MRAYYSTKHYLKRARHRFRRARVGLRWGFTELAEAPIVFGNAMPKSGSHLLIQVLLGLTELGPFVDTGFPPVTRSEDNVNLSESMVLKNLERLGSGDIAYGYLHARQPYLSLLTHPDMASIFIYRDPRDVVVSHVFYATEMHEEHGMRNYYREKLGSNEERMAAAIRGVDEPGYELSPIRVKYDQYIGWLEQPEVLPLRFEALILDRQTTLDRLLDFLARRGFAPRVSREEAVERLEASIAPRKSGTFRRGQPGEWREHFTPPLKALFKEQTGDLLMRLGYEQDEDW